jgi:hypothetical protein
MIIDGEQQGRALEESFDYVIVGSGASGATVARVLADTGCSVAVVEEGPAVESQDFEDRRFPALPLLYREMGLQMAHGRAEIPILQGSCLGGSTVVNSAIMWRLPEDVWEDWARNYGIGAALPLDDLHRHWDQIERDLSVQPTPRTVWGGNNRLMQKAGQAMEIKANATRRSVRSCRGSARCQSGCPFDAKQSMAVTYLKDAEQRGATLLTRARADRIVLRGDRAVAVEGSFARPSAWRRRPRFMLRAQKAVVVAASAIQTPGLLRRSGVRSPHLGSHFQAHPGALLIGLFDEKVNLWFGATQGFESDEHRRDRSFKVDAVAPSPELLMAKLPGWAPAGARISARRRTWPCGQSTCTRRPKARSATSPRGRESGSISLDETCRIYGRRSVSHLKCSSPQEHERCYSGSTGCPKGSGEQTTSVFSIPGRTILAPTRWLRAISSARLE